MRSLILSGAALFALLTGPGAWADNTKPPEIDKYIHSQAPYGEGTLTKLIFKAYDATLWTDAPQWSMDSPFALSLHYDRNFESADIVKRTIEEMQHVYNLPATALPYNADLRKLFPSVQSGDVITAIYLPKKGTIFFYNSVKTGFMADLIFAERFFGIWLSPHTSEPELRQSLLGRHGQ